MQGKPLRVMWLGPSDGGLGWLRRRLDKPSNRLPPIEVRQITSLDMALLQKIIEDGAVDRIVWACRTRVDYSHEEIALLLRNYPELPLAVACENWWDGARRTGLGIPPHLSLPWYRWWDGWSVWLEGNAPELFGPVQNSPAPWVRSSWFTQPTLLRDGSSHELDSRRGIVVGNCRQTCNAWRRLTVQGLGLSEPDHLSRAAEVEVSSWDSYLARLQSNDFPRKIAWVLWDDSCLDTSAVCQAAESTIEEFFEKTTQVLKGSLLIAALSMPRALKWLARSGNDQCEFIVKPDSGQALMRLLVCRLEQPSIEHK